MKRKWQAALLILSCIVVGFAFYRFYYTQTPHYAVQDALLAAKNHDFAHFENRVDLDALLESAYDDLILPSEEKDAPILTNLTNQFRPLAVSVFRYLIHQAIEPTSILPKPPHLPLLTQDDPDPETFRKLEVRNIELLREKKPLAYVAVQIRNQQTDRYCTMQLQLKQDSTGYWRIRKIDNIQEVVDFFNADRSNAFFSIGK